MFLELAVLATVSDTLIKVLNHMGIKQHNRQQCMSTQTSGEILNHFKVDEEKTI